MKEHSFHIWQVAPVSVVGARDHVNIADTRGNRVAHRTRL